MTSKVTAIAIAANLVNPSDRSHFLASPLVFHSLIEPVSQPANSSNYRHDNFPSVRLAAHSIVFIFPIVCFARLFRSTRILILRLILIFSKWIFREKSVRSFKKNSAGSGDQPRSFVEFSFSRVKVEKFFNWRKVFIAIKKDLSLSFSLNGGIISNFFYNGALNGKFSTICSRALPDRLIFHRQISSESLCLTKFFCKLFYKNFINKRQRERRPDDTQNTIRNQSVWKSRGTLELKHQKKKKKEKRERKKASKELQSRERNVAAFNQRSVSYSWWTRLGRSSRKKQTNLTDYLETERNRSKENYKTAVI